MLWLETLGRSRWYAGRPYPSLETLIAKANDVWWSLEPERLAGSISQSSKDRREKSRRVRFQTQSQQWSGQEQAGVSNASRETVDSLAALNRAYEAKVWLYLHHLRHRQDSDEMLSALRERLENDPADRTAHRRRRAKQNYRVETEKIDQLSSSSSSDLFGTLLSN